MKTVVAPVGLLIAFFAGIVVTLALERQKDVNDEAYRAAIARTETEARAATPTAVSAFTVCGTNMGAFVAYGDGHVKFFEFSDPEFAALLPKVPQSARNTLSAGGALCGRVHESERVPFFGPRYPGERDTKST